MEGKSRTQLNSGDRLGLRDGFWNHWTVTGWRPTSLRESIQGKRRKKTSNLGRGSKCSLYILSLNFMITLSMWQSRKMKFREYTRLRLVQPSTLALQEVALNRNKGAKSCVVGLMGHKWNVFFPLPWQKYPRKMSRGIVIRQWHLQTFNYKRDVLFRW